MDIRKAKINKQTITVSFNSNDLQNCILEKAANAANLFLDPNKLKSNIFFGTNKDFLGAGLLSSLTIEDLRVLVSFEIPDE